MSQNLTKHPEIIKKENKIKDLQKQLKKRKTTLKSLKTRLSNMQEGIDQIFRKMQGQMMNQMSKMEELIQDVAKWAKELLKSKNIGKEDKQALQEMVEEFSGESIFGENYEAFKEKKEQAERGEFDFDEETRAKMRDMFQEFKVKPPEQEQKNIRKTFLKLSQKFHPDLAKTEQEQKDFHKIQQEINEAYQNNDIHALLEIERLYVTEEFDFTAASVDMDDLDKIIKRCENELDLIEKQIARTSNEIKNTRQSELGQMLTQVDRAERYGEGLEAMEAQQEEAIEMMTQLRDGLKDSVERDEVSPILMQMMMGGMMSGGADLFEEDEDFDFSNRSPEEVLDVLNQLMGGKGDSDALADLFGGMMEEEKVDNPKFPIDSSVKIKSNLKNEILPRISMKGWEGRVTDVFYEDGRKNKVFYSVEFDSITMQQMPAELIEEAVAIGEDFQEYEIEEKFLTTAKPRDTEEQTLVTYRRLFFEENWDYLDEEKKDRLRKIMFRFSDKNDEEHWDDYLRKSLKFPFEAKIKGFFEIVSGQRPNKALQVHGILGRNFQVGHIMEVEDKRTGQVFSHPLVDLQIKGKKNMAMKQLLGDYAEWAEDVYEI